MNKKIFSAIVSIAMTATMFPMTVFAEDEVSKGGISEGEVNVTLEGIVDKDIFSVALPTSDLTQFDFIIDPQGLITATGTTNTSTTTSGSLTSTGSHAAVTHPKYANAEFEPSKTMYFKSYTATSPSSTDRHEYTSTSVPVKIENKSSIGIDASIEFVISGVDGVTFKDDNTFASDTSTSMYLAVNTTEYEWNDSAGTLSAGTPTTVKFATTDGVTSAKSEVKLERKNDTVYKYQYTAGGEAGVYSYVLDDGLVAGADTSPGTSDDYKFEYFEMTLTGAVNPAGDWFALTEGDAAGFTPKIDVVFDIALEGYDNDNGDAESGGSDDVSYSMTAYNDAVVLPSTSIASVKVGTVTLTTSHYALSGNNFTIKAASTFNTLLSRGSQIDITFSDGTAPISIAISNGA